MRDRIDRYLRDLNGQRSWERNGPTRKVSDETARERLVRHGGTCRLLRAHPFRSRGKSPFFLYEFLPTGCAHPLRLFPPAENEGFPLRESFVSARFDLMAVSAFREMSTPPSCPATEYASGQEGGFGLKIATA